MKPFIQRIGNSSTLEGWRQVLDGNQYSSFNAFAYVTESGVAQLEASLKEQLGQRNNRWIFGFDYGRSQPPAIRRLAETGNHQIRIHDGAHVVQSNGFVPRYSFHLKTVVTILDNGHLSMQLVGSGNLSATGLQAGIEAGCVIDYQSIDQSIGSDVAATFESLWDQGTPFEEVIDEYEHRYHQISSPVPPPYVVASQASDLFWIDVGYVTRNRGPLKPGNQFDLPRGAHIHFGLAEIPNPPLNSVLGNLRIRTPIGEVVDRRMRYGNNAMEKLTLPIPEQFGYDCYDGKILTFKVVGDEVTLEALEFEDFMRVYGAHINSTLEMQSGRRYGTIKLNDD